MVFFQYYVPQGPQVRLCAALSLPAFSFVSRRDSHNAVDPNGSPIDVDMDAFDTSINQQRLTGADQAKFVALPDVLLRRDSMSKNCDPT